MSKFTAKESKQQRQSRLDDFEFMDYCFKIIDMENAELKAGQLLKLKGLVPQLVQIRKFCVAFLRCSMIENFKISTCYDQMKKYDIIIIGSGPVGLSLAKALSNFPGIFRRFDIYEKFVKDTYINIINLNNDQFI